MGIFCVPCCLFGDVSGGRSSIDLGRVLRLIALQLFPYYIGAFVTKPFVSFKKSEKMREHAQLQYHIANAEAMANFIV